MLKRRTLGLTVFLIATSFSSAAFSQTAAMPANGGTASYSRNASPQGAKAFIVEPSDGATVPATFTVKFGSEKMAIVPAGTAQENSGHFHLLIDQENLPAADAPIPANDKIIHYGKAQTETSVTLAPGKHTLRILIGDANHVPHDPVVASEKITVTVE